MSAKISDKLRLQEIFKIKIKIFTAVSRADNMPIKKALVRNFNYVPNFFLFKFIYNKKKQ